MRRKTKSSKGQMAFAWEEAGEATSGTTQGHEPSAAIERTATLTPSLMEPVSAMRALERLDQNLRILEQIAQVVPDQVVALLGGNEP